MYIFLNSYLHTRWCPAITFLGFYSSTQVKKIGILLTNLATRGAPVWGTGHVMGIWWRYPGINGIKPTIAGWWFKPL